MDLRWQDTKQSASERGPGIPPEIEDIAKVVRPIMTATVTERFAYTENCSRRPRREFKHYTAVVLCGTPSEGHDAW